MPPELLEKMKIFEEEEKQKELEKNQPQENNKEQDKNNENINNTNKRIVYPILAECAQYTVDTYWIQVFE